MLTGLRLREVLISSHKEEGSIHDCSTSEHSSHQSIVTRTVDKGHMSEELKFSASVGADDLVFFRAAERPVALRRGAYRALV